MPSNAIKPTEAGTDKYSPEIQSANTPPIIANGMLERISTAWRIESNVVNSSKKIKPKAMGTTIANLCAARC